MALKDKLLEDLKIAMKNNDTIAKNTIQLVRAAILNEEKDKQIILTDQQTEDIVMKEKKKRIEAQAQFEKAQRQELIDRTIKEIDVLNRYLPEQMSEYDLSVAMKEIINENELKQQDIGKLIRLTKDKFGNAVNGQMVANLAKQLLQV